MVQTPGHRLGPQFAKRTSCAPWKHCAPPHLNCGPISKRVSRRCTACRGLLLSLIEERRSRTDGTSVAQTALKGALTAATDDHVRSPEALSALVGERIRQIDAARVLRVDQLRPGLIILVDTAAICLNRPTGKTETTWAGWIAAPDTEYATKADVLLEPDDEPFDPFAAMVQTWNPVQISLPEEPFQCWRRHPRRALTYCAPWLPKRDVQRKMTQPIPASFSCAARTAANPDDWNPARRAGRSTSCLPEPVPRIRRLTAVSTNSASGRGLVLAADWRLDRAAPAASLWDGSDRDSRGGGGRVVARDGFRQRQRRSDCTGACPNRAASRSSEHAATR